MPALKQQNFITIPSLKVVIFVEHDYASVALHRRKAKGGFGIDHHSGLERVISLPEIEATLALADLFERIDLAA
ncbi:MAG: hypothetical protein ABI600_12110 [Luteolibacter sp.]